MIVLNANLRQPTKIGGAIERSEESLICNDKWNKHTFEEEILPLSSCQGNIQTWELTPQVIAADGLLIGLDL